MKRADFLKRLGIGLGAVVVAPMVLAEMPAKDDDIPNEIKKELTEAFNNTPAEVKLMSILDYKQSHLTIEEIMDIYHQTGMLIYHV